MTRKDNKTTTHRRAHQQLDKTGQQQRTTKREQIDNTNRQQIERKPSTKHRARASHGPPPHLAAMGDPIARLVTPWLQALTERCGSAPLDLFSHLPPDCASREEFRDSGLYLFPGAASGQFAEKLTDELKPIFKDIHSIDGSHRSKVANYQSFQGVSSMRCSCKYNYEGAAKQLLYHRGSNTNYMQPKSVTTFLDDILNAFGEWGKGEYSMINKCCDSTLGQDVSERQKPRDFNLVVVNEYNFATEPRSQIPWHDDSMGQSARNPWGLLATAN